mgnify:CR=1 FL=1
MSTAAGIIIFLSTVLVLACAIILVFNKEYDDGVIGRLGLSLIGLAALARGMSILQHWEEHAVSPSLISTGSSIALLLWSGIALFLIRHTYRFLRFQSNGEYAWTPLREQQSGGKKRRAPLPDECPLLKSKD